MFLIREALRDDLDEIHSVARHLNTVNLPHDRKMLDDILVSSERSFAGELGVFEREYLLVMRDMENDALVGTSMILAQHGTKKSPHIFFEVLEEEHYSDTIDRHFVHQCLRIGYSFSGPTEIGGLILVPQYRGHAQSLGRFLSYVRFLYIAMHRDGFRDEILSELLPPLNKDGTSALWEQLGRHFTGLSYHEADRLSKGNKEFIRSLFPEGRLYTSLMSQAARDVIGVVGEQTRGVEKMIRAIGFKYTNRIDPFDGGPHFIADTDDVTLVKNSRRSRLAAQPTEDGTTIAIVCVDREDAPHFLAVRTQVTVSEDEIALPQSAIDVLQITTGASVGFVPL